MTHFKQTHTSDRFPGIRWKIIFGNYEGIQQFAVNEIQKALQSFVQYTVKTLRATSDDTITEVAEEGHLILMGTPNENPLIKTFLKENNISLPSHKEGYYIDSQPSSWNPKQHIIIITSNTPTGVLYGVEDFNARVLGAKILKDDPVQYKLPEKFPVFNYAESPSIEKRGIWSWGYVIYDYRRFLDNMARLRMNILTIWNDCPPINMPEVIEYAHNRGIKIILGFPWGWGMQLDLSDPEDQQKLKDDIIEVYETQYSHLDHNGIYFQTLTETNQRTVNSKPRAMLTCELVNKISSALLEKHPELDIQFGLHAISILDDYPMLETLDKRVTITWEDAGLIPYAYELIHSKGSPEGTSEKSNLNSTGATIEYSKKIATLREDCSFAMVAKGFSKLRWGSEFEHHQTFILGERSEEFMQLRLKKLQASWDEKNGLWFAHYQDAVKFYQELLAVNPDDMNVTALIEDGLFELKIQPCVALFANILWDPNTNTNDLMIYANSAYLKGHL